VASAEAPGRARSRRVLANFFTRPTRSGGEEEEAAFL